jgi:hypothetical protein
VRFPASSNRAGSRAAFSYQISVFCLSGLSERNRRGDELKLIAVS